MNKAEIIRILKDTADELTEFLYCPHQSEGKTLNIRVRNGKSELYCRTKDGSLSYLNHANEKLIKKLASDYYERKMKAIALREKKQIDSCIAILEKDKDISDVDNTSKLIPEAVTEYAVLSELTAEGYARKWQNSNNVVKKRRSHKQDDYHKYKTLRGEYVGSKSEVIIADRLFVKGIPYHYEIAFTPEAIIDKSRPVIDETGRLLGYEAIGFGPDSLDTLHPDFYVLNKRTRKAYYWEHLGKMDDPEYCRKNFNRFMRILDAGYVIGEDLLVTHEDSKNPLMTESIDRIIERYLL